jgi:uncharacterized membrane protein YdjX (TVP38/TMEM64 family)
MQHHQLKDQTTLKSLLKNKELLAWLGGILVIVALAVLWIPLSNIELNTEALQSWISELGPLAPVAFVLLNIMQIVAAPIPGYPVQALGGVLFDFAAGSIYTVGGMVAGGVLAAWLGRRLGRPWLERRVGVETLDRWSGIAHINSFWTWWIILLIPLGDVPYFIAGLSKIRLSTFALAILTSRGPFTVLIVWAAANAIELPLQWVLALFIVMIVIIVIGFSQAKRIEAWSRAYLNRITRTGDESEP